MTKTVRMTVAILVWIATVSVCKAETTNTNPNADTNKTNVGITIPPNWFLNWFENNEQSQKFWERYAEEISRNGSEIFADKFGGPSILNWVREINRERYSVIDRLHRFGKKAFVDTGLDSLRETVTLLRADEWLSWREEVFSGIFRGSVGNTVEERDPIVSSMPSYASIKRSWYSNMRDDHNFERGIRLWDGYSYIGFDIGHRGERPMARIDIRFYTPLDNRIGEYWIRGKMAIQLNEHSQLVWGGQFQPNDLKSDKHSPSGSIRWEYHIGNGKNKGIIALGAQIGQEERLVAMTFFSKL